MRFRIVFWSVSLSLFLLSCASKSNYQAETVSNPESVKQDTVVKRVKESATSGEIYIAVDESLQPIIQAEIDNFQALYQRATIHPLFMPGEQAVIAMLTGDSIRLAVVPRKLSEEEAQVLEDRTITPKYAPIFKEGVVLMISRENRVDSLSSTQLRQVLSGEIQSWKDLDPGSTLDKIALVFDHAQSSTLSFIRDSVLEGKAFPTTNVYAQTSTPEVFDYLAKHPEAIGITGIGWISDMDDPVVKKYKDKIKFMRLERSETAPECAFEGRFFGPYQSFLYTGCYPLTRTAYTILRETIFGLGTGFVAYLDGPIGQRVIHKSGLGTVHTIPRKIKMPSLEEQKQLTKPTD